MNHSSLLPSFANETDLDAYEVEVEHIGSIADGSLFEGDLALPENAVVNTSWSLLVKIARINRDAGSDNPPCNSGDANCEFAIVQLPLGAQVHEVHYYMNKTSSNSSSVRRTNPGDHSWAKVYRATQHNSNGFTWVRAKFKNWRSSYDRWGQISVTWTLPT